MQENNSSKISIGQEPITRDEIATVYAAQRVNGLQTRRTELLKQKYELAKDALLKVREITEDFLKEDLRYNSLMTFDALIGDSLKIVFTYNITTHDKTVWTIADNMVVDKAGFNNDGYAKFTVNVSYRSTGANDNGLRLFTTEDKICFGNITDELHKVAKEVDEIEASLRVDWKSEYLKTLVASYLNDNLKAIGNVTLPDIKLLNF